VKYILLTVLLILLLPVMAFSTGEKVDWQVISGGGIMNSTSTNFGVSGTVAQTAVSESQSTNYKVKHGFWNIFLAPPIDNCCMAWGVPGDPNKDNNVNLTDILDAISYVYVVPLGEPQAADGCNALYDANGDGLAWETPIVNLTDILDMISHVYVAPIGDPVLCCPPGCLTP